MQFVPSQSSTQKFIICKFAGLQVKDQIEPPITAQRELIAVKKASIISQTEHLQFLKEQKVWNLWLQLFHQRILDKEPNDELRQNFIHDEMQLHTSTRSELNLIKSVIYVYIYNLFIFYILNNIYYNFIIND